MADYKSRAEIQKVIYEIIVKEGFKKPEELTDDLEFTKDLGADSLDSADIQMNTEDGLDVRIEEKDLPKLQTVGSLVDYCFNQLKKGE